jgi:hypothetical protein
MQPNTCWWQTITPWNFCFSYGWRPVILGFPNGYLLFRLSNQNFVRISHLFWFNHTNITGCSKSHETHGLLWICVSWTPHFKEIVASTSTGLKPPRLLFMGASEGYCVFKSSTRTHCKSFRPTFSALWTGYQLAHCKTCSLTWFFVCISVKSVMVDIFSTYYKK